jgi:hypothetical protein
MAAKFHLKKATDGQTDNNLTRKAALAYAEV